MAFNNYETKMSEPLNFYDYLRLFLIAKLSALHPTWRIRDPLVEFPDGCTRHVLISPVENHNLALLTAKIYIDGAYSKTHSFKVRALSFKQSFDKATYLRVFKRNLRANLLENPAALEDAFSSVDVARISRHLLKVESARERNRRDQDRAILTQESAVRDLEKVCSKHIAVIVALRDQAASVRAENNPPKLHVEFRDVDQMDTWLAWIGSAVRKTTVS